ncbi:MAG TPA: polyphosphate:AMP phosphotransferase [Steroidobacteraceae bacterium]|nr:polyphosphate:AMP phosphotransferase [Steroidobacteraceae bacterium]
MNARARDYRSLVPALRDDLLGAQLDTRKLAKFSVAVIVTGVPAAGRSETVNKLLEWIDPKYVTVHAFGEDDTDARHPPLWRYWRKLPAFGRIAFYFYGWYGQYMGAACHDRRKKKRHAARELERIRRLEAMLSAEGVRVVKIHLDLDADTQRQRLKKLRADKLTRWRVTDDDLWLARHHKSVRRAVERCLTATDQPKARWHLIEGADEDYREVRAGELLRDEMLAGLEHARKPVRTRASKAANVPPLTRRRLRKVDDDEYEHELERLQGHLALLTRRSKFRKRGLVLAFEGMDAAGKGGAIRRLTRAFDARQYQVVPVSAPTAEERSYPYLWRFWRDVPARGHIAIFDRSWYGRVLVERVRGFATPADWRRAYGEICEFERELLEHGLIVAKFWLQVGKAEQLRRFKERDADPLKRFKVDPEDWTNRTFYDAYQAAAAEMVLRTNTRQARWHIVSADDKKSARLHVLQVVCETIEANL